MEFKLVVYKPDLFRLGKYNTKYFINLIWYIITFGRVSILLLLDDKMVVHSVYFTPRTFRFAYMNKNDINIGQAETLPEYRGRGIFYFVMKLIMEYYAGKDILIWSYCDVDNKVVQKAFEKAGFEFVSYAKMSKLTRVVRSVEKI